VLEVDPDEIDAERRVEFDHRRAVRVLEDPERDLAGLEGLAEALPRG